MTNEETVMAYADLEHPHMLASLIELRTRITKGAHFWVQNFNCKWHTIPYNSKEHASRFRDLTDNINRRMNNERK